MFKSDKKRNMMYFPSADLINIRANKDSLQWCIFEIDKLTGGYKILNEGTLPVGKVLSFKLAQPTFAVYGDKSKPKQPLR